MKILNRKIRFECLKWFKESRTYVEDSGGFGKTSTSNTNKIVSCFCKMIHNIHWSSIRENTENMGISYGLWRSGNLPTESHVAVVNPHQSEGHRLRAEIWRSSDLCGLWVYTSIYSWRKSTRKTCPILWISLILYQILCFLYLSRVRNRPYFSEAWRHGGSCMCYRRTSRYLLTGGYMAKLHGPMAIP